MYKHIIFDLDGTILDTVPDLQFNLNRTFKELGLKGNFTAEQVMSFLGSGKRVQIERALTTHGYSLDEYERVDALLTRYYSENASTATKPFPTVLETLKTLKNEGFNLYVATNKPENVARVLIDEFFPNLFIDVRGDRGDGIVKPAPLFLKDLLTKHKIEEHALFVGDSYIDYLTAVNAGLDFALVPHGYDKDVLKDPDVAPYILINFMELVSIAKHK